MQTRRFEDVSLPDLNHNATKQLPDHPCLRLDDGRIEVWCIDTEISDTEYHELSASLSPEEINRASKFKFERHRNAFVATRSALRMLLTRYANRENRGLQFVYGKHGKPSLAESQVEFNVSHTDGAAVLVFAMDQALGADVERIRPVDDMMQIAHRFFSPAEAERLALLPKNQRQEAFFWYWTRKEAYIKGIGAGLSSPLKDFRVEGTIGASGRLVHAETGEPMSDWMLHDVAFSPLHAAAVAYKKDGSRIAQSEIFSLSGLLRRLSVDSATTTEAISPRGFA